MRVKSFSLGGPLVLGLAGIGITAAWIYLLFFVIAPLSR
jgi:hypothetical protein